MTERGFLRGTHRLIARIREGKLVLAAGILGALFVLMLDPLGIGKPGFQAAQILGLEVAILIVLLGIGLTRQHTGLTTEEAAPEWVDGKSANPHSIRWILLGFMIVYVALFLQFMFLNPQRRIHYFNRYLPDLAPIGADLNWNTANIRGWLSTNDLDAGGTHYYPPLHAAIFAPIVLLAYPADYYFMTMLTVLCMTVLVLWLPHIFGIRGRGEIAVFFFLTAMVSYGMQFELERGQFNVVAYLLGLLGIYLHHFRPSFRALAVALFSAAVQLKVYPAALVLLLVGNWRNWRGNLLGLLGIGTLNAALLLALGPVAFTNFLRAISEMGQRSYGLPHQHSIRGLLSMLESRQPEILSVQGAAWLAANKTVLEMAAYVLVLACVGSLIARAINRQERGLNLDLLAACTLAAIVLPSISYDYTLTLVAPALGLCLAARPACATPIRKVSQATLTTLVAGGYAVMLVPYLYRPLPLWNSCLPLLVVLAAVTLLSLLDGGAVLPVPTVRKSISQAG